MVNHAGMAPGAKLYLQYVGRSTAVQRCVTILVMVERGSIWRVR